jgi:hypothetical protein
MKARREKANDELIEKVIEFQRIVKHKDDLLRVIIPTTAQGFQQLAVETIIEDAPTYIAYARKPRLGPHGTISVDHTFKTAKCVRVDKNKPFVAVCTATNEYGEVLAQCFVFDLSMAAITPMLRELANRLVAGDHSLLEKPTILYIDNCCSHGEKFKQALAPLNVIVKLDLFHWVKRWTHRLQIDRHASGAEFLKQMRNIVWARNADGHILIRDGATL